MPRCRSSGRILVYVRGWSDKCSGRSCARVLCVEMCVVVVILCLLAWRMWAMRANQYLSYIAVCGMGEFNGLSVCPVASLKSLSRDLNTLPSMPGSFSPLYACFKRISSRRWRRDGSANPRSSSGRYSMWELVDLDMRSVHLNWSAMRWSSASNSASVSGVTLR